MTHAAPTMVAASRYEQVCSAEQATTFTPAEIREAISYWVTQNRLDIADALVAAGVSLHPDSEDILAIGGLVAEVNQDWAQAQDCIERLMRVQGDQAPAETWLHLVRVMRCRESFYDAFRHAKKALKRFPGHSGLQEEHSQLAVLLESAAIETEVEAKVA